MAEIRGSVRGWRVDSMAYVPDCKYDVFISYRHVDDEFGWVKLLEDNLQKLLNQQIRPRPGESWKFEFFRDKRELPRHGPFPPELEDAVSKSAVLLVVMSRNYLADDSNWCQRERKLFLSKAPGGVPSHKRVFVVRRDSVDHKEWPTELRDLTGYAFFQKDDHGVTPVRLDFENLGGVPIPIFEKLSNDIRGVFNELRTPPAPPPPPAEHELAERIAELIRHEPDAIRELKASYPGGAAAVGVFTVGDDAMNVALGLLKLPFEDCLRVIDRAHERLSGGGRFPKSDAMAAVNTAGDWLLGAVYDEAIIGRVRDETNGMRAVMFEFPAATETMAEIILAGAQRRAVSFRSTAPKNLTGTLRIEDPPDAGRDRDGEIFIQDFVSHITGSLGLVSDELLKSHPTTADRIKLVVAELNGMKKHTGSRYYYVFRVVEEQTFPESWWRSVIGRLSELFPPIVFLKLNTQVEAAAREVEQLYPLKQWKTRPIRPPERS